MRATKIAAGVILLAAAIFLFQPASPGPKQELAQHTINITLDNISHTIAKAEPAPCSGLCTIASIARNVSSQYNYVIDRPYFFNHTADKWQYKEDKTFKCADFSNEFVKRARQAGQNCWCVLGFYTINNRKYFHQWARCNVSNQIYNVEAISGNLFINSSSYIYKKDINCEVFARE